MQQYCSDYHDSCSKTVYQSVDVDLPIALKPTANVGKIKMSCCGEPRIELCQSGCNNEALELKITQTVCYKIPIEYCVSSNIGEATSECQRCSHPNAAPCGY